MAPTIRRLGPADAPSYRALRLDALAAEPAAFGAAPEEEAGQPVAWFGDLLARDIVLAAGDGQGLAGMAGVSFETAAKRRHHGHLWGLWVAPRARGGGVGRALVSAAVGAARGRVSWLHLGVATWNAPALALYRAAGFEAWGLERAALRVAGEDHDEHRMSLRLGE